MNLDQWYAMGPKERLHRMFHPRRNEEPEVLSPDQSPATSTFEPQRDQDAEANGMLGHNEQMQFLPMLKYDTTTAYGRALQRGTVFLLRQDFNTVVNLFAFSIADRISPTLRAGVHFLGLGPSAQHFEKMRLEMDGMAHQEKYGIPDENLGFTKFLVTTHRQDLLLPPRSHRSFPLAEML